MKKLLIHFYLLFPLSLFSQFDAEPVFPQLTGQELLENVVETFKPGTVLPYGPARDSMFANIYNVNDSLYCVYSGHRLYMDPDLDPTEAVFLNGIDNGINTEHTYPRSKGAENGFARSDMNHLYATRVRVNSDRGNLPFGDINDENTLRWYLETESQSNIPSSNIDDYSEWDGQFFEPREAHKGNVARAMFYFYTMYKTEADAADPSFFDPQVETFCNWHEEDPVDSLEWVRAMKISTYQDGKVNPFVLDCTLPGRTYCQSVASACRSVSSEQIDLYESFSIFPNPADDVVNIHLQFNSTKKISYRIYDIFGRILFNQPFRLFKNEMNEQIPTSNFNLSNSKLVFLQITLEGEGKTHQINRLVVLSGE